MKLEIIIDLAIQSSQGDGMDDNEEFEDNVSA